GAFGRIPEPGAHRSSPAAGAEDRRPLQGGEHRHPHQPPHPLCDRNRRWRSAEDGPDGKPRNAGLYIFAVALEDRAWHHERSYAPERASRPSTVALWHKIVTVEDAEWTRRYHSSDPRRKAFGGRVVVTLKDGQM